MAPGFNSRTDGFAEDAQLDQDIIDEEELASLKRMKDFKRNYRELYKELRDMKAESSFNQQSIDNAKQKLVSDFEQWYEENFDVDGEEEEFQSPSKSVLSLNKP